MALTVRSNIPTADGTSTTITITKPSNAVQGDRLFGIAMSTSMLGNTISPPDSTWRELAYMSDGTGGGQILGVWWKICGASEAASWSFTQTNNDVYVSTGLAVAGGNPYGAQISTDASGPNIASLSLTTIRANDIVFSAYAMDQPNAGGLPGDFVASSPGGLTQIAERWELVSYNGLALFQEDRASTGAGAHAVVQNDGGDPTRGGTVAIWAVTPQSGALGLLGVGG
jgi:hypothetical protein